MVAETVVRFLLGGAVVSLFAVAGHVFKPASFAGIFGSAPSVALATLSLAFVRDGRAHAATESQWMMIGALGLIAYSAACGWTVARPRLPVWEAAAFCWVVWFVVTFGLWGLLHGATP